MERVPFELLASATESLTLSQTPLPSDLKVKTAELILRLMQRKEKFGLFVILGWQQKWNKYLDLPDAEQDIFAKHRLDVRDIDESARVRGGVGETLQFDGAILIDRRGNIIHSGVVIEGMRPSVVAQKINPGKFRDLSEQFGFETKVHTRHLTAIAASYVFKGTTVFTVSEETGAFHVMEAGRIVHRS